MADRKVLVVYYSRTGTTQKVAEAIASRLGADLERIVDRKERHGATGFASGGKDAMLKRLTQIDDPVKDPVEYDLVVIGTPVWAWTMSPAARTWITRMKAGLSQVAFFLTTGGTGIERTFSHMAELCGRTPLATLGLTQKAVLKGPWQDDLSRFVAQLAPPEGPPAD